MLSIITRGKMRETDLYLPVKHYLEAQGYSVKGEIKECDIVAVRGDDPPLIVELKTAFSLQLVLQGVDRQGISDRVYLGFPAPKRRQYSDIIKLCRRLGLGVLIITGEHVEAAVDPVAYQPRKIAKRKTLLLKEFTHRVGDTTKGGSTARGPRMTAYRQDALRCAKHLGEHGATKVAAIKQATNVSRASTILLSDVYGWFQREERGIYKLSPKGEAALVTFSSTIAAI
jgi:hypothetical protein